MGPAVKNIWSAWLLFLDWSCKTSKEYVRRCQFCIRTHIDKNTDLIRSYLLFKYRPNTDTILAHLKKNTDLSVDAVGALLHAANECHQPQIK